MDLNQLLKKISLMQAVARSRLNGQSTEGMQVYVQGFCDGLDGVVVTIKKAVEAERMRQRLAKLESELALDPEPDWSQVPDGMGTVASTGSVSVANSPGALSSMRPSDTV